MTVPTRIDLWAGWSVEVPPMNQRRNPDGSWSAWGADWVVDVQIVEMAGDEHGELLSAEQLLGQCDPTVRISGPGWIGSAERLVEKDGENDVYRLAARLCADNTLMSCWVSYMREEQRGFAERIIRSAIHLGRR